ncbi:hypothetical protein O9929_25100 [Vibrio lentus]|nr:hypothetical protein [Vibrio lentus]
MNNEPKGCNSACFLLKTHQSSRVLQTTNLALVPLLLLTSAPPGAKLWRLGLVLDQQNV